MVRRFDAGSLPGGGKHFTPPLPRHPPQRLAQQVFLEIVRFHARIFH